MAISCLHCLIVFSYKSLSFSSYVEKDFGERPKMRNEMPVCGY